MTRRSVRGHVLSSGMSAALTLIAKKCGGLDLRQQVLFYPVTDAAFATPSYH